MRIMLYPERQGKAEALVIPNRRTRLSPVFVRADTAPGRRIALELVIVKVSKAERAMLEAHSQPDA